jgi:DNA-binding MarR family transcriptional regulator
MIEEKAYIFGMIFALSNKLQLVGDRMDEKLTVKQWLFLAGVVNCGQAAPTLSDIAACIGSSRQNVKKMALILEKQGFVSLQKDARDARALRVSLTDACWEHLKWREAMEVRFIEELFHNFDGQELTALGGALKKLEQNAKDMGKHEEEEI